MKIGIVIGTKEPESAWNALRLANTGLKANHDVSVFLMNGGVEIESINHKKYDIEEQLKIFQNNKGKILACGTCIKSRNQEETKVCPISTMQDLLKLVEDSDKVLTFG